MSGSLSICDIACMFLHSDINSAHYDCIVVMKFYAYDNLLFLTDFRQYLPGKMKIDGEMRSKITAHSSRFSSMFPFKHILPTLEFLLQQKQLPFYLCKSVSESAVQSHVKLSYLYFPPPL